jgi:hypothetical protein
LLYGLSSQSSSCFCSSSPLLCTFLVSICGFLHPYALWLHYASLSCCFAWDCTSIFS